MGVLSRFFTLMKANINHQIEKARKPEKIIEKTLREITLDLRVVQSELNALQANVKRFRRDIDECEAEIRKLERYRERAQNEDDGKVGIFEAEIEQLEQKKLDLLRRYNLLILDEKQLKLLEEKLGMDKRELDSRYSTIREKTAILEQQQKIQQAAPVSSGFNSYEEELNFKLEEAEALAELRNQAHEIKSIDEEIAKLEEKYTKNNYLGE